MTFLGPYSARIWGRMNTGTKSVLFGAHCFFIHPWFVWLAYWRLYGWSALDPRVIVACVVHDWGYWSLEKMDDEIGETHPILGARIMGWLFDDQKEGEVTWFHFALLHSRYYSNRLGLPFSRLCVADKAAFYLTPWWVYIPCVWLTGEWKEYLHNGRKAVAVPGSDNYEAVKKIHHGALTNDLRLWHTGLSEYLRIWVEKNKECNGIDETAVRRQ